MEMSAKQIEKETAPENEDFQYMAEQMVVDEEDKVSEAVESEFDWDNDGDFPMPEDNISGFMD